MVSSVLYTDTVQNLVSEAWLHHSRMEKATTTAFIRFWATDNFPMRVRKIMPMNDQVEDLCFKIWFVLVKNLAEQVLLDAYFMDLYFRTIFPVE